MQPFSIHLNDSDAGSYRSAETCMRAKPDMIAITGDLIDGNHTNIDVAVQFVKEAKNIAPIYYVTGNHEAWTGTYETELVPQLEKNGVVILKDECALLERNDQHITLLGLEDPAMELKGDMRTVDKRTYVCYNSRCSLLCLSAFFL